MNDEVWSNDWVDKTLQSFNVPEEPEFDLCDLCKCPTHIRIGKWVVLENKNTLICNQCQIKNNYEN